MEYMLLHSCFLDLVSSFFMAYSLLLVKHNLNTVIFKLGDMYPWMDGRNKQHCWFAGFKGIYVLTSTPICYFS